MPTTTRKKVCSFCGRNEREVGLLITGINGYICEDCARQAYTICKSTGIYGDEPDPLDEPKKKPEKPKLKKIPKPKEIKEYLTNM